MTPRIHEPPVVVLGGISLVRTLGLAGIRAIVAGGDPHDPALVSRHCSSRATLPALGTGAPAADALASLGAKLAAEYGRRVPLMYGSDDGVELINKHRGRLERYFLLLLNDPDVASALFAKDRFQAFALDRGLPLPAALSWDAHGGGSLRACKRAVVMKPSEKTDWHHSALCRDLFDGDAKAMVYPNGAACADDPGVAKYHHLLTFQEYIPGGHEDLWSYHGFADENGEVLAAFTGRKIRTYPAINGESAFIELAHDETLEAVGRDVVRRCPLKGVFKMDFKRDAATGQWYLLEINARWTLWNYLGACNGVNLMRVAYDYLVYGRRPAPMRASTRYRWHAADLDFKAYRELAARGEITLGEWIASLVRSRRIYNVFAWRDPLPWAFDSFGRVRRKFTARRILNRINSWRVTAS
jgi:D-aspartate ligase